MGDWGNIPNDVATKIAEHIEFVEDFDVFGFVCSRWRIAVKQARFGANITKSSTRVPWLMLPETDDTSNRRRFFSLYNHKVREVSLPLSNPHEKRVLSSHGWLLSVNEKGRNLCLINPLSGAIINLPKVTYENYCYEYSETCFEKFILSDNPSTASDFTIALVLAEPYPNLHLRFDIITFWRYNTHRWVRLWDQPADDNFTYINDITCYQGTFYGVDDRGSIWCFQINESGVPCDQLVWQQTDLIPESCFDYGPYPLLDPPDPPLYKTPKKRVIIPYGFDDDGNICCFDSDESGNTLPDSPTPPWPPVYCRKRTVYYLVESDERLLLVCRVRSLVDCVYLTTSFEVFELNVENWEANKVDDLEDVAIFVGWSSSFAAKVSIAHGCKPNSIYFTDDYRIDDLSFLSKYTMKGKDMGVYNLADESIDTYYDGPTHHSELTPFMWLQVPNS